ncbi:single-stranded DNA-binding protein [Agromyces sp. CFH 90414]|uniref:Single-stranded DNA-binding protein n=1 Tax=Agromyces agglutinans TaxID=2662258 RepID=A0A6I2F8D1_9MICO|nr:single-stranded DNA-binding protein [Agromyces agglutinans]MRG58636.1 single-stranded DNA-binding protein [Agromyces agglutinans]
MSDQITVTGVVGSDPRAITTPQGLPITSFRLASRRRYFDRAAGTWQDGETNWYTVSAFRQLAYNAGASVRRGERVIVHGRLKQRAWTAGEKSGTSVEIEADTIGHDLVFGITQLRRLQPPRDGEQVDASAGAGAQVGAEAREGEQQLETHAATEGSSTGYDAYPAFGEGAAIDAELDADVDDADDDQADRVDDDDAASGLEAEFAGFAR